MSRDLERKPKHGPRECPGCRLVYNRFSTGLTFAEVKQLMKSNSDDPRRWRYRRRPGVLGYWRQLKTGYWNHHVGACAAYAKRQQRAA